MAKAYEIRIKVTGEGTPQVKMIKRDLEAVKRAAGGVDKKMVGANRQTKALAKNMRQASTSAKGMGLSIKKAMGYFGVAAGGYMLVGQLRDASGAAMQLEKDVANINTLLGRSHPLYGQSAEDIKKIKRLVPVLDMHDVSKGYYEYISATGDAAGAMEATTAMAKAAAGGQAELGTVVKGTTTLMNAYTIAGKDAMKATDLGLKTVHEGKLNYEEYAQGISMVAGTARVAGVSLRDLHAAISVAARVQEPEQAFTGLNMAIASLYKRKPELAKLGIEVTTLSDTLRQIHEKAPTAEEWNKIMPDMRGVRTLQALDLQYDSFAGTLGKFGDVSGTTMADFLEQQDKAYFKMAQNKNVLDEYKLALGKGLNEALIAATSGVTEFKQAAEGVAPDTSGIEAFTDSLTEAAGQLHTINKIMKPAQKVSKWQWEMMGWDPLGVMGKGPSFGAFGKTERVISYPGSRPAARPRTAAAGNTYNTTTTTIHNLTVKSDKVDKDSLMKTVREIAEEENPAGPWGTLYR